MKQLAQIIGRAARPEDFLKPEIIAAASEFIWTSVSNKIDRAKTPRHDYYGRPGRIWSGSQTGVVNDLFPELFSQLDKDQAKEFRIRVNAYLKDCGVMICRKRSGGKNIPAVWWISDHWTGLKVTTVSPATPAVEPDEETDEGETTSADEQVGNFRCRAGCDKEYTLPHVRIAHERREHRVAISSDGTVEQLADEKITDDEIREIVLTVAEAASEPETLAYFFRQARVLDARVPKMRVERIVLELAEDPAAPLIKARGIDQYLRFKYVPMSAVLDTPVSVPVGSPLNESILLVEDVLRKLHTMRAVEGDVLYLHQKIEELTHQRDTAREERDQAIKEKDEAVQLLESLRTTLLGTARTKKG